MAKITAAQEMALEAMPDAPDEEWLRALVDHGNSVDRQVVGAFQRQITTEDNTTSRAKDLNLVHGVPVTVANPLDVPIQGIYAIGCTGLEVGTDGKPNGGIYDLATPEIVAKPSTKSDGSWIVTAYYPTDGLTSGYVGETVGPISRIRSAATAMTDNVALNVCAQPSISVPAGQWVISGGVGGVLNAATNFTRLVAAVSLVSATLPATGTAEVPTDGEYRTELQLPSGVPGGNVQTRAFSYPATFTTTTTLFLVGFARFTVNSFSAFGSLAATRIAPYMTGRTGRVKLFFFGG
jgi:hypothetical protein